MAISRQTRQGTRVRYGMVYDSDKGVTATAVRRNGTVDVLVGEGATAETDTDIDIEDLWLDDDAEQDFDDPEGDDGDDDGGQDWDLAAKDREI